MPATPQIVFSELIVAKVAHAREKKKPNYPAMVKR
jgi:hypothetical protein